MAISPCAETTHVIEITIHFNKIINHIISGCGQNHMHNFGIKMDAKFPEIWTTELGRNCIQEWLTANKPERN